MSPQDEHRPGFSHCDLFHLVQLAVVTEAIQTRVMS